MLDESFVFLSPPHVGIAYRMTNNDIRQYCKNDEIISFIINSINNNTLNKGVKYYSPYAIKYIYKFNKGSNKRSLSVIIHTEDYEQYKNEIINLNENLKQNGYIKQCNIKKIKMLLDTPLALLTYTNIISIIKK